MSTRAQEENNQTSGYASTFQIVVFRLGDEEYGISIDQIKEVVITPTITRVPQKPAFIKGVANIRGNIIAILDLEQKFGLQKTEETMPSNNNFTLVIDSNEYKMGVLVKEVPNTLTISSSAVEDFIFTGDGNVEQSYIKGIVKLDKRLIIMIDIFKVLSQQEEQQIFKKQTISI
ncbi:chemotaxis protein CheW [Ohtaekwangia koreensis]|uniref:Purine-binding chemotaxis protein CheW n=1 Tax=Ohtaekwangia koreensis TaxID=688867 RepID=A0A1T5JSB0_9BACT|nr:chemotaxis protein CheW [Ohtaekwangia koreensis]SKC54290.1 purine-binding chemotaxis protein CheW [Ohtaekwangia koreensis]